MISRAAILYWVFAASAQALDAYGGRTDLPCLGGATSRFYAELRGVRWWVCTPVGNSLFVQGVYAVGPQGNYAAKYGIDSVAKEQTLVRLKSWGFNLLNTYSSSDELPWNRTNKIPAIVIARPGFYGMITSIHPNDPLPSGTLDQNIKDVANGNSPYMTGQFVSQNGIPDYGDLTRLGNALTAILTNNPSSPGTIYTAILNNTNLDYVLGVAVEDSDQTWGFWNAGSNDPFDTQPSGHGGVHGGYWAATMSPIQQADAVRSSLYVSDQTVYAKKSWHDFLVAKYSTVGALNTAWGSSYTTFDSSDTQVTAESVATTDGTNFAFTHTLANAGAVAPDSIRVFQDGTMIAGDCYRAGFGGSCNPGTGIGAVWGSTASGGSINYSTKSLTVSFSGIYEFTDQLNCTTSGTPHCTGTIADYNDATLGVVVGNVINIKGSVCCSSNEETVTAKSGDVGGFFTYTWTNTAAVNGSESYNAGARDSIAKVTVPAAGHVLTVSYQVNGWDSGGTGLMDEDGRPAHTWMGTDPMANSMSSDPYTLHTLNANTAADMRTFLNQLGQNYFSAMRTGVRAAFTSHSPPELPPMYIGPDSFGTWTSTPRKEVLQAAAGYMDMAVFGSVAGFSITQAVLDYVAQWFGKPIFDGAFSHAQADSPFAAFPSPTGDYTTQQLRGAAYNTTVNRFLYGSTTSGTIIRAGFSWWQYGDNASENTNWGLVTLSDNAYDGRETVAGVVPCSSPLQMFTCGGEAGNYGDVITSVKAANALWLSGLGTTVINSDVQIIGRVSTFSVQIL